MEKVKITTNYLRKLPVGNPRKIADSETPNLQLWIGATSMAFYLVKKVAGRQYNINLGRWPDMTLEEARQAALRRLGALVNYQDINAPAARSQPTVGDAMRNYIEKSPRQKTKANLTSLFKHFSPIQSKKIIDVTRAEIKDFHDALRDMPVTANHAVKKLATAIDRLAKELELELPNPARGIPLYPEFPRRRFLSDIEAPKLMDALQELRKNKIHGVQADALLCMIYTGARKSNVLQMRIEEIAIVNQVPTWTVPRVKSKNGKDMFIPFNQFAWEIVQARIGKRTDGLVFVYRNHGLQEVRKTFARACAMAGIQDCHIHDLRRTLGSWMLMRGIPIEVISKTLGHSSIQITEQVYAHLLSSTIADATTAAVTAMKSGKANE